MKNLIKKILKEEFNPEDFDWVPKENEMELIKDDYHRRQVIGDVIDKVKEYKGWRITTDGFDGVTYWNGDDDYTGMATPEWDGNFTIPVDIMYGDNNLLTEYNNVSTIITPEFKYVVEVVDWYRNHYFETVYNLLTKYINRDEVPTVIEFK